MIDSISLIWSTIKLLISRHDFAYGIIPIYKEKGEYKFLIVKSFVGKWNFPKGHKNLFGESKRQAAFRELSEETGIKDCQIISEKEYQDTYSIKIFGIPFYKTVTYYIGQVKSKKVSIKTAEIHDFAWLSFNQLIEKLHYQTTKQLMQKIKKDLYGR